MSSKDAGAGDSKLFARVRNLPLTNPSLLQHNNLHLRCLATSWHLDLICLVHAVLKEHRVRRLLVAYNMAVFLTYSPTIELPKLRTAQGKVAELRLELNSGGKKDKNFSAKKVALKRIVANMTMSNNDMVALFPDIIGCMGLQSLEIKKMLVRQR